MSSTKPLKIAFSAGESSGDQHAAHLFLEMKKRYRSDDPFRIIERWKIRAAALNASTVPVNLWIPFLFWTIRDWMGFEGICLGFHDQPMLIREMCEFLIDYYI